MTDDRFDARLVAPLLAACALMQIAVAIARIATSYRAVEAGLPATAIGFISAAFALLPILFAVAIGRYNDRSGPALLGTLGSALTALAIALLALLPPRFWTMTLATCLLGLGQILLLSTLQLSVVFCSPAGRRDAVVGNFTLAMAVGQFVAPLVVTVLAGDQDLPPSRTLLVASFAASIALLGASLLMARRLRPLHLPSQTTERRPVSHLLRHQGLFWLVIGSSFVVTSNDLTLVYLPVLGIERDIPASVIGVMLSLRAAAAMVSRSLLVPMVRRFGKRRLIIACYLSASVALVAILLPLPVWGLFLAVGLSGFCLGLAGPTSMSLTLDIAPASARATALSLRLTANRMGQFLLPSGLGLFAGVAGTGSIFAAMGVGLAAMAATLKIKLPHDPRG